MTVESARKKVDSFYAELSPSDEQIIEHLNNLEFLASKKDISAMRECGNVMVYYKKYDLAKRFYDMVIKFDKDSKKALSESTFAHVELGDLYKNHHVCDNNYSLAFDHYALASTYGNELAKERIADMYKDGLYVKKDYNRYVEMITKLYESSSKENILDLSICQKMAEIKYNQKDYKACADIIRHFEVGSGFSRINILSISDDIKCILKIHKLKYKLKMINEKEFDIFSIDALTDKHQVFSFKYRNRKYELKYIKQDKSGFYEFMGIRYNTLTDFIIKAKIQDKTIIEVMESFTNYRVCV